MVNIFIKFDTPTVYRLDENGDMRCTHEEAFVERACCAVARPDCPCNGQDAVICPAIDCTGILPCEVEQLFNRLEAYDAAE